MRIADNVVSSFTEEDVEALGENVVLILNVVKDMTQPQIMNFVRSTVNEAEVELEKPVDTSLLALLRQMNDPAVRRGLAQSMRVIARGRQPGGEVANRQINEWANQRNTQHAPVFPVYQFTSLPMYQFPRRINTWQPVPSQARPSRSTMKAS